MADSPGHVSSLCRLLRSIQRVVPPAVFLGVTIYEVAEHGWFASPFPAPGLLFEIVLYAVGGPLLLFLSLTWLLHRVSERDAAEAGLAALYRASRAAAAARGFDELQAVALALPESAGLRGAATILLVQEGPEQPWFLAGSRNLAEADMKTVQSTLASDDRRRMPSPGQPSGLERDCPFLTALATGTTHAGETNICLSLSGEPARRVLLGAWAARRGSFALQIEETLASMAAGVAVAMDRATYQARQRQLLEQVGRDVLHEKPDLGPTLARILADIAAKHPIAAGAVYLIGQTGNPRELTCAAAWPNHTACGALSALACDATRHPSPAGRSDAERQPPLQMLPGDCQTAALLISSDGHLFGVLVLAGQPGAELPHAAILGVITSMIALLIRNSQLYARLESQAVLRERTRLAHEVHDGVAQALAFFNFKLQQVQRLLDRGDVAEAAVALQELRSGGQEVYQDVRQMIRDLSEAEAGVSAAAGPEDVRAEALWTESVS